MKKTVFMITMTLVITVLFSCTPQAISTDGNDAQACCGDNINLPPPPPPPFGGNYGG